MKVNGHSSVSSSPYLHTPVPSYTKIVEWPLGSNIYVQYVIGPVHPELLMI